MTLHPRNKPINYFIKKDNELTKAEFYDMTVTAYRIILLASSDKFINQIRKNPLETIQISPADYHDIYGSGGDTSGAYKALKESQEDLVNAKLKIKGIKRDGTEGKWDGYVTWMTRALYNDTLKVLEVRFSVDVLPLVLNIQKNYTYYNLRNIAKLNSMYSIRLYELMMFWRKKGSTPALSVAYMRTWLGVKDGLYDEMKIFNRDVIKRSVDEITKKTDIELNFEPQKEGRSTVGYLFSYTSKITQVNQDGEDESQNGGLQPGNDFPPGGDDEKLPF